MLLIFSLIDKVFPPPRLLPKALSIDEFRGNIGEQKFQAILTSPKNHKALDILPSHPQSALINYFKGYSNQKEVIGLHCL